MWGETMIGERLQDIRKDHSDTQQDLADKLHASLYAVRCWEQGKSTPATIPSLRSANSMACQRIIFSVLRTKTPFIAKGGRRIT